MAFSPKFDAIQGRGGRNTTCIPTDDDAEKRKFWQKCRRIGFFKQALNGQSDNSGRKTIMDMETRISQQLNLISDNADRERLRSIIEGIFIPLYDETKKKYSDLEERVYNELPFNQEKYSICGTIAHKDSVNRMSWLFPLLDEDLKSTPLTTAEIFARLNTQKEAVLTSVYIGLDYLACRDIWINGKIYSGKIVSGDKSYSVGVKLRPTKKYEKCLEALYKTFIANGLLWSTINIPYLAKFFDVVCVRMDSKSGVLPELPAKLEIDFQEHNHHIVYDLIPLWNVEEISIQGERFPFPALDKVNYEYRFAIKPDAVDDGFIVVYDNNRMFAMRRESDTIIITSPVKSGLKWKMLRFHQRTASQTESFQYPVFDNRQKDSFAGRMIIQHRATIKTKAELFRILNSFNASEKLMVQGIYVVDKRMQGETWGGNKFIQDEIRDITALKTLLLQFKPTDKKNILNRDIMSFLISQIQLVYPEYICIGVLI